MHSIHSFVLSCDHDSLVNTITRSIEMSFLVPVPDPEVLGVLITIEFHERGIITAVEAGMLSNTKSIEFPDYIIYFSSKGSEYYSEFFLLFFKVHKSSKECWNNVVSSFSKECSIHFSFELFPFQLCFLFWI